MKQLTHTNAKVDPSKIFISDTVVNFFHYCHRCKSDNMDKDVVTIRLTEGHIAAMEISGAGDATGQELLLFLQTALKLD